MIKLEDLQRDGWQSGINQIINCDCLAGIKLIPDKSVDCVFSDVPYLCSTGGVSTITGFGGKNKWRNDPKKLELLKNGKIFEHNDILPKQYIPDLFRVLKDSGHIYIMTNSLHLSEIEIEMKNAGFKINNILVMIKNNAITNQFYMKNCEFTIFARKGEVKPINNFSIKTALEVDMPSNKFHETEKPVGYVSTLIENSSNEGDLILDPFMGSWTTARACKDLGRNFIGFEISEKYCAIGEERLRQELLF